MEFKKNVKYVFSNTGSTRNIMGALIIVRHPIPIIGGAKAPPRHPRIDASDGITQRKLASLILLLQSDPSQTLLSGDILVSNTKYVQILIVNTVSCSTWRQTTDDINQADRRLTAGAINWEL